ncbi:MAG TPA: phosphoribosyltransferase family protein [Flavipsychrobacter sp.]|nr:phosphoribosyltransferase family protein [Flavipsychrobacter sp.]
MTKKTLILDQHKIALKLQRMAYQIWECNSSEKEIILIGVEGSGVVISKVLAQALRSISPLTVTELSIQINKKQPLKSPAILDADLKNKVVVLVDDVANSGRTLLYAMKPLLNFSLKKIQIAVLIDRKHKSYPVAPDIVGYSIATTLQEHIDVDCEENDVKGVYLL